MDSSVKTPKQWMTEKFQEYYHLSYQVEEKLYSKRSEFQLVEVFKTPFFGNMLFNDGLAMVSEKDEFVYHEMISHVPASLLPSIKKVLIIGGGDGGTAREILRYPELEACTMVEIDPLVIEAAREFLPTMSVSFNHPKMNLIVEDGIKFVKETSESFDLILVDSTDPIGPAQPLFGPEFYKDIHACLSPEGIVVSQAETPYFAMDMQKKLLSILNDSFKSVGLYNYHNLTYPGGTWSFSIASKKPNMTWDKPVRDINLDMKLYNKAIHQGAFALPEFQKQQIAEFLK